MSFINDATRVLRAAGGRMTAQRQLLLKLLAEYDGQIDADKLLTLASAEDSNISRATVYRTLNTLADAGLLQSRYLSPDHERLFFELSSQTFDFILTCRSCHQTMPFQSDLLNKLQDELANDYDFADLRVCICATGICETCQTQMKG